MKYIYLSSRLKSPGKKQAKKIWKTLSKEPNYHIAKDFLNGLTWEKNDAWRMFLYDDEKKELVGTLQVTKIEDNGIKYINLNWVYIDENYRKQNLCYELIKQAILKNEKLKWSKLIRVVMAGDMPILKCLIKVFKELNYKVKKYKSDVWEKQNIKKIKNISFENAVTWAKKEIEFDNWPVLFFDK